MATISSVLSRVDYSTLIINCIKNIENNLKNNLFQTKDIFSNS